MSAAVQRLVRARRVLVLVAVARALLIGAAVGIAVSAWATLGAALVAAAASATLVLRRTLPRMRLADVALWAESRSTALRYALVTLVEAEGVVPALSPATRVALEAQVARAGWRPPLGQAAARALAMPLVAMLAALGLLLAVPRVTRGIEARALSPRGAAGTGAGAAATAVSARLRLRVRVVPPPYSGIAATTVTEPSSVAALEGSSILLSIAARSRPRVVLGGDTLPARREEGGEWRVALAMPARPAALVLAADGATRVLALESRPDSLPVVTLRQPARDSVLPTPTGTASLAADARDDLGLASAAIEFIVSSGEGESFRFRSGTLGARAGDGARTIGITAALPLADLAAGDIVHVRAVARDRRPGAIAGASETRTFRVARTGERDSVSVDAAPPPEADRSLLSQRMLIRLAEALAARVPRLARAAVIAESRRIGADQRRLRQSVGDIVFSRLGPGGGAEHAHAAGDGHAHSTEELASLRTPQEVLRAADAATGGTGAARGTVADAEGESPVVAINRPLLEAYNAMWEAGQSLDIGEPWAALPPMRRALAAIQRARQAERVYLRGRPPTVVVDVARVRLAGVDRPVAIGARGPRPALDDASRARARRLAQAAARLDDDAGAAIDSLLVLRVDAIADAPDLARVLGEALERLRAGRDATDALARARRLATEGRGLQQGGAAATWRDAWPTAAPVRAP